MNVESWFRRWGIVQNPFKDEEAKDDTVFLRIINEANTHPDFEKVYGSPNHPSTSVVFGEKGAGKTALRMLITRRLLQYNEDHPRERVYVIEYDDWNPLLDRYVQRKGRSRSPAKAFRNFRLWDHFDGIMALGVTPLIDHLVEGKSLPAVPGDGDEAARNAQAAKKMPTSMKRSLSLLTALYYSGHRSPFRTRFTELFKTLKLRRNCGLSVLKWVWYVTVVLAVLAHLVPSALLTKYFRAPMVAQWAPFALAVFVGIVYLGARLRLWSIARRSSKDMTVVGRQTAELTWALQHFSWRDIEEQPFPSAESADSRYQLMVRFQEILYQLGFKSFIVLVDRVDEPHIVHGDPRIMRQLVWPFLDNKFLKHPGMGVKLLLPLELGELMRKEDKDFFDRTRLDKHNLIFPLEWSGATLIDIANSRLKACLDDGAEPVTLMSLFHEDVREDEISGALEQMRQPRDAFKFLYRLINEHCKLYTEESGSDKISKEMLRSVVRAERNRLESFKTGFGHG